jgi:hypothetical protein
MSLELEQESLRDSLQGVVRALRDLGNGDAATHMGAIEAHGLAVKEGAAEIASAIRELAEAIRESRS